MDLLSTSTFPVSITDGFDNYYIMGNIWVFLEDLVRFVKGFGEFGGSVCFSYLFWVFFLVSFFI